MTGPLPGGSLGDAFINVHANTSSVEGDVRRGLDKAGADADREADKVGTDIGGHIGKSVEKEVGKHGPGIGREIGKAVEHEVIDLKPNFRYNVRGKDGKFISRAAAGITKEVENAFSSAVSDSGFFSKIGQAFQDAIGSSFGVSGKSPLTTALIPVYVAIAGLVGALLQALNAGAAVLTTFPALIAAVGLQVGVLYLAFKGVGTAIQGAFAAKNAKELKDALVGLTPSAQSFVKSLLPLKPLFEDLKNVAQQNFFKALGDAATKVINNIAPLLRYNISVISTALGGAVRDIALAFASPDFHNFIAAVIPATIEWVRAFGPAFAQFLIGLIDLGRAAIPLLIDLGKMVNSGLASLGKNLSELSRDPKFREWLGSMEATLKALGPLFKSLFQFVVVFLDQLNKAGGKALIEQLAKAVDLITAFLATEAGWRALNELIGVAIGSFYLLAGALIVILFLGASVQAFIDWLINTAFPAIGRFFADIGKAIADWFTDIGDKVANFFNGFKVTVSGVGQAISDKFIEVRDAVGNRISEVIQFVKDIPGKIVEAIGNLGSLLFSAGKNLINGLINGIENAIPGLRSALGFITNMLPNWKGPEEKDKAILKPSGEAVMAGFGEGIAAGASDIRKMLGDFTTGIGDIGVSNTSNHILFGSNALQVNFRGALPTQDEAMATGVAVGAGISSQLAARNTRLAVRTL